MKYSPGASALSNHLSPKITVGILFTRSVYSLTFLSTVAFCSLALSQAVCLPSWALLAASNLFLLDTVGLLMYALSADSRSLSAAVNSALALSTLAAKSGSFFFSFASVSLYFFSFSLQVIIDWCEPVCIPPIMEYPLASKTWKCPSPFSINLAVVLSQYLTLIGAPPPGGNTFVSAPLPLGVGINFLWSIFLLISSLVVKPSQLFILFRSSMFFLSANRYCVCSPILSITPTWKPSLSSCPCVLASIESSPLASISIAFSPLVLMCILLPMLELKENRSGLSVFTLKSSITELALPVIHKFLVLNDSSKKNTCFASICHTLPDFVKLDI